jgi:hypothetical protein
VSLLHLIIVVCKVLKILYAASARCSVLTGKYLDKIKAGQIGKRLRKFPKEAWI